MTMAKKKASASAKRLTITLVRSPIGFNKTQAETRGMIHKVRHLVTVQE